MKTARMTISLEEEDMKQIKNFCKDSGFNLSSKTVQLWKQFIENESK
jgi:hypothetical protein